MKAISLSLIFSIIFSIVLARNSSGSKSVTGCFPFCRKKKKKIHKMTRETIKSKGAYDPDIPNIKFIDEFDPIILEVHEECQTRLSEPFTSETDGTTVDEVTGFLRRENESKKKGVYIRPYEEEPEDVIKSNFTPLKNNYQPFKSTQKNSNKQGRNALALLNSPINKGLSTLHGYGEINEEVSFFMCSFPGLGITIRELRVHSSWNDSSVLRGPGSLEIHCIDISKS
ncbi:erythrocyte membrane antigen 1 [Plasmodium vinckei lentum]|uniref:Erythrocyte membrane antigen 1 n=1 Tax=Plasmodium vinckei lentum TaxID=138297 RepID=A0A6V7S7K2_PLAVN|nr:erythrocyte membrane antigen 1 [Plasmodium vinckei lentum]